MKKLLFIFLLLSCQPERPSVYSVQVVWNGCVVESYMTNDTAEIIWSKDFKVLIHKIQ
jgi:hypothetical protein